MNCKHAISIVRRIVCTAVLLICIRVLCVIVSTFTTTAMVRNASRNFLGLLYVAYLTDGTEAFTNVHMGFFVNFHIKITSRLGVIYACSGAFHGCEVHNGG